MARSVRAHFSRWSKVCVHVVLLCASLQALAEPPETHEIIYNRPSGFWTSNRPAVGGAYRYRLLLLGVAIALIMLLVIMRLIRRASSQRPRDAR